MQGSAASLAPALRLTVMTWQLHGSACSSAVSFQAQQEGGNKGEVKAVLLSTPLWQGDQWDATATSYMMMSCCGCKMTRTGDARPILAHARQIVGQARLLVLQQQCFF